MTKATVTTTKRPALPKVDTIKHMVSKQEEKPLSGVRMQMDGNELVVRLDVTAFKKREELPLSSSEKSYTVASSHGGRDLVIPGLEGLVLNMNLYAKKAQYDEELLKKRNKAEVKEVLAEGLAKQDGLQALAGLDADTLNALVALAKAMGGNK